MYVYGGLYPLLMAPLIDVIQPIIRIPRLLSAISVLLSSLLMFCMLRKRNSSIVGSITGAVILAYALCLIFKITLAGPDLPGFLLLLCGLFLFMEFGSSFWGLLFSAIFGVGCFFIKQYYVLPIISLGIYLFFFRSKRMGILYLGRLALLWLSISLPIRFLAPLYFRYTILHHLYMVSNNQSHALFQASIFSQWFAGMISIFLVVLIIQIIRNPRWKQGGIKIRIGNLNEPIFEGFWIDANTWNLILMFLLLVLVLGKNTGNVHTYFLELLLPFLLLTAIPAIEKEVRNPILRMGCLFACLTCLFPLGLGSRLDLDKFSRKYQQLEAELQSCQSIYGAAFANQILWEQDKPIFDSGQSVYGYTIILPYNLWRARLLGGHDGSIENKCNVWMKQIGESVTKHEFGCIAVYSDT
jgi:hypothetical protein